MQPFDITITPTGVRTIDVQGDFIYYRSGSAGGADTTIELKNVNGSETVYLQPGDYIDLRGKNSSLWQVSNYKKQGTIIGLLLIGSSAFGSNRVTGSVEVVDGGKARTMAGSAFMGSLDWAPTAGKYAAVQLYNPPASGKNVMVEQVSISSSADCKLYLRIGTHTALTQQINKGASKLSGGALAMGEMRRADIAAIESGPDIQPLFLVPVKAGVFNPPFKFSEPLIVTPGKSLVLVPNLTDKDCQLNAEWYEESV